MLVPGVGALAWVSDTGAESEGQEEGETVTIGDARFNTVGAIMSACADLAVGSIRVLTPSILAALWSGAPAVMAGRVGQRCLPDVNRDLEDRRSGLRVVGYERSGKHCEFVVTRDRRSRAVMVTTRCVSRCRKVRL